jgi:kynurenine formamidase
MADAAMTLDQAFEVIQSKEWVDLTNTVGVSTPIWSGFGQMTISAASDPVTHEPYTIEKHGFHTMFVSTAGQNGTHVDPPAHFAADGLTMDKIPLKQMILPLVVFDDTSSLPDANHALTSMT